MNEILLRCPKCKKVIKYLVNRQSAIVKYHVRLNKKNYHYNYGKPKEPSFLENPGINDWQCPECNEVLYTNSKDVIKFFEFFKRRNRNA